METIQAKKDNKEISTPEIEAQESAVQDLMEQLRKSLEMTG
jgi:non-homologous end joining protein Ku